MFRSLFLRCGSALLVAVACTAVRAAAPPARPPAEPGEVNVEQRLTELEWELSRTRAELAEQRERLYQQDAAAERLPAPGTAAAAVSRQSALPPPASDAGPPQAKLSEGFTVGSDMKFNARWNNGLFFETAHKDFTFHVGGRFHYDWVWFDPDPALELPPGAGGFGEFEDGAFMRRARFQMDGKMWEVIDWNVEFDFAGTSQTSTQDTFNRAAASKETVFQDVWIQVSELPLVGHFRAGHLKQPMGLENYNSSKYLTFMERGALQDAFLQEYDPGFLLWDNALADQLWWGTGFYRIDAEETGIDFGDGEYAWTSRIAYLLWDNPDHRYLLHVGASYSLREGEFDPTAGIAQDVVRFRARPEIRNTPRFVDTGALGADDVDLAGLEMAWVSGPLSIQGEYLMAHVDDAVALPGNAPLGDVDFHGYYIFASYFLTGEHRPYDTGTASFGRVKPYENFWWVRTSDGCCKGSGAWELAARWSTVDLSDNGLNGGTLDQFTCGVNWYWNPNVRWMWNYNWADRNIDAPQQDGDLHTLAMRISLDF